MFKFHLQDSQSGGVRLADRVATEPVHFRPDSQSCWNILAQIPPRRPTIPPLWHSCSCRRRVAWSSSSRLTGSAPAHGPRTKWFWTITWSPVKSHRLKSQSDFAMYIRASVEFQTHAFNQLKSDIKGHRKRSVVFWKIMFNIFLIQSTSRAVLKLLSPLPPPQIDGGKLIDRLDVYFL